jgi:hypothetical protein
MGSIRFHSGAFSAPAPFVSGCSDTCSDPF